MTTIPAKQLVNVLPGVQGQGGSALQTIGLFLTPNTRTPIGTVLEFPDAPAVSSYYGPSSSELTLAEGGPGKGTGYFGGFTGATAIPASMLVAQYNTSAVAAYLRGGNAFAALTLAQLQALSGSLTVVVDGYSHVISSINFSGDNSFSAVAAAIQAAFSDPSEASFTASIGATFTGTASGAALTVSAVANGYISPGDTISGTGVPSGTKILSQTSGTAGGIGVYQTSVATTASTASITGASSVLNVTGSVVGTITDGLLVAGSGVTGSPSILSQISGTAGGIGLYQLSGAQQTVVPAEAMTSTATAPTVTFDSVSGAFVVTSGITGPGSTVAFATGTLAAPLLLTSATGAVLSQGAAAATPASFMNALIAVNPNWLSFMTAFDPDGGSGNTQKQAFAAWKNSQNNRYAYVCWDTDITPTESVPATGSLGYILPQAGDSGTFLIYEPSDLNQAAFVMGTAASIDFEATNGHITFAYKQQPDLVAGVTSGTVALNLAGDPQAIGSFGNGYNFYGAYADDVGDSDTWLQRGTVTGPFQWFDAYVEQVWLNSTFKAALLSYLGSVNSVPYGPVGAAAIEQVLSTPINAGLKFGAFGPVPPGTLSGAQIAAINAAAGSNIATVLQTQGWYLQIGVASPATRGSRASPPMTFWYITEGSVQALTLNSIAVTS